MSTLKDCDELFMQYFDRWLNDAERARRGFMATRPDMLQSDSLIGLSPSEASPLETHPGTWVFQPTVRVV